MATLLIRAGAFALLSFLASEIFIVDLEKKSIAAFDRYVLETERGMDDRAKPFLRVDGIADAKKKTKALESLRKGELIIESLETRANGRDIDVPDAQRIARGRAEVVQPQVDSSGAAGCASPVPAEERPHVVGPLLALVLIRAAACVVALQPRLPIVRAGIRAHEARV